jgi:hypothetical protein
MKKNWMIPAMVLLFLAATLSAFNEKPQKFVAAVPAQVTTVDIYLKSGDSTVSSTVISFPADIGHASWINFLKDFRDYFFMGIPQRSTRYQVLGTLKDGKVRNTHLNFKFTDIAFIAYQTQKTSTYTITCTASPQGRMKDQYWSFYFHNPGQTRFYLSSWNNGLNTMVLDYEMKYMYGPAERKEYVMQTVCKQVTDQVLIDWKYVKALQLKTNTAL